LKKKKSKFQYSYFIFYYSQVSGNKIMKISMVKVLYFSIALENHERRVKRSLNPAKSISNIRLALQFGTMT